MQSNTTVVKFPSGEPAPAPAPAPAPVAMTPDRLVEMYVLLRDRVAEIKQRHKDELARPTLAMAKLEGLMLDALNASNVQSMRANQGTFYKINRTSCTVEDWSTVLDYIRQNNLWELLESRVSKSAVEAIVADTGAVPPGVKITTFVDVGIRRA